MITLKAFIIAISMVCSFIHNSHALRLTAFPIGGLFNRETLPSSLQVFSNMIEANRMTTYHGRSLVSKVVDSYSTSLELCPFTSEDRGIVALIDARPTYGICDITCLLCNRLNITHLSLGWEPTDTQSEDFFSFAYYPPPEMISKAYATLIKDLGFDKFTILYEDDGSFIRLQQVINTWPATMEPILFRKLDPYGDNRETFKYIFKVARMSYHVLDCNITNIHKYMNEIVQVENATEFQSFILTNLDAYSLDFKAIDDLMANVSTLHLTTPSEATWKDKGMLGARAFGLETALAADALSHLEKAIRKLQLTTDNLPDPPPLCQKSTRSEYEESAWPLGYDLREALIKTTTKGFSGHIEFDSEGKRTNFMLHYSKLDKESQFVYAGDWDYKTNVITKKDHVDDRSLALKPGSKIRVVTKTGSPYFSVVDTPEGKVYRGYCVDLIDAIFKYIKETRKEHFEYEFYIAPGNEYGNQIEGTNKWTGIIGELMDHKAHLGICDLTITSERNSVLDFSIPFMTLGISLLFREEDPEAPDRFSFIKPLSLDVWLYLATTYVIVSFVLLVCARMSQDDWVNPHPCNQNPENLENIWSLYNCMWLTMGSIMTQGCDILPRAAGSRWIAGVWWFFALIVTASYTANMSTFLSNSRRSNVINDVKELSEQNKISYGALYNGSTYRFFQTSNDTVYSKIWSVMNAAKPTVFTTSNLEGKDRVARSNGKYAFFMESTSIEYYIKRNCTLKMLGSKLDSKEYGIAMPKNYGFKGKIDHAILSLQELGELEKLKKKWWEDEDNQEHCEKIDKEEDDNGSLQMKNTSGIFLVLGTGGILGLIVAIIDFMFHARQISVKEKVTFKEALSSEWHASLNPRELHKPTAPPRSAPPSTASPSPQRERSQSRAVSVLRAASSFINFDEIY
ncbi:glutamate receptor ionotropic, kainate 2-like [Helicoverpa zea]|uniref:glutamate receptor ionotropic, kainate 2-like n=1 Tax=Helicoverpa zea TaxID=7113 RepID=UPI001F5A6B25|nr:glutamate receptor ionotropic, kainate 2-like [Helicoverpa zea]